MSPDLKTDNEEFGSPTPDIFDPNANSNVEEDYRFSVGQLPLWAKKQIGENNAGKPSSAVSSKGSVDLPKGRWAQRMDSNASGITVKSFYQGDSVIPFPPPQISEKGSHLPDSDGSKDSSLESNEFRNYRGDTTFNLKEIPTSKVTRRGGESSAESGRGRTLTDDSSASSLKMDDFEGTEHDGDVEDYSDNESIEPEQIEKLMYYPQNEETSSDYTVNAMDVEELRRSQRRLKKPRGELPLGISYTLNPPSSTVSVSGSQDSEDDDDEISTPSGELAERNLLSLLSVSSESLDRVGRRESYLKSTFESLGNDLENRDLDMTVVSGLAEDEAAHNKSSFSSLTSKFLTKTSSVTVTNGINSNAEVISAVKATQRDPEAARKREELQRRIEETRRKLQSIGYKSNLRNSQSITDLRESAGTPLGTSPSSLMVTPTHPLTMKTWGSVKDRATNENDIDDSNSGGLRRACSLSDLSKPSSRRILPSPPNNVSGRVARPTYTPHQVKPKQLVHSQTKRPLAFRPPTTDLTRSSSMGFLNQASDSESEHQRPRSSASGVITPIHSARSNLGISKSPSFSSISRSPSIPSAMRPTISSSNKSSPKNGSLSNNNTPTKSLGRRITSAMSTGDIRQALHDSSSSEDIGSEQPKTNVKARVLSFEKSVNQNPNTSMTTSRSIGGISSTLKSSNPSRRSLFNSPSTPLLQSMAQAPKESRGVSENNKVLSRASCELAIESLKASADQLLSLQRRLAGGTQSSGASDPESNLSDRERAELLQYLSTGISPITQSLKSLQFPPAGLEVDNSVMCTSSSPSESNPLMVQMMQQYSDMLLSMIQQRMGVPAPTSPR